MCFFFLTSDFKSMLNCITALETYLFFISVLLLFYINIFLEKYLGIKLKSLWMLVCQIMIFFTEVHSSVKGAAVYTECLAVLQPLPH